MSTTPAIPAWLSHIFGARSHRRKRVRLIWKFVPILLGLACAAYLHPTEDPFLAEELSYRQAEFVRSSHAKMARARFVGADAHADVAVVIVTHNSATDIAPLIDDLRVAALDTRLRVIVVDNQSSDGTVDMIRRHPDVTLIESNENLGYAGGINAGLPCADPCDAVLILNPDLALAFDTVTRLQLAAEAERIGAVVPLMLDGGGATFNSLRREPTLTRAIGDAILGRRLPARPGFLSETDSRPAGYREVRDVDWATGAALLVPATVFREVGPWNEEFFMYSEETDYFRRIRESGRLVRFEPAAVVKHSGRGSGTSTTLAMLKAVNRVRYVENHHGRVYSELFRGVVAFAEGLRSYDPVHRRTFAVMLNRPRWGELAASSRRKPVKPLSGPRRRGAVIVPAYNEASVIKRTIAALSQAAVDGYIELIVVCNGCTDDTAAIARSVPGVRVVELEQGSKPGALNAGDAAATLWPRLYLDADVEISADAVLAVLDRLALGDVLAARPAARYDFGGASPLVRSYYRARLRIPQHKLAMWGAGAYGLNARGHQRFGAFPMVTGDDFFVDTQFGAHEKVVVATDPSVVRTPVDVKSLLAVRRRSHRGTTEVPAGQQGSNRRTRSTSKSTAVTALRTIRGPGSALDAAVYLGIAVAARWGGGRARTWERDDSSRSTA